MGDFSAFDDGGQAHQAVNGIHGVFL
jgi:hypothetical protein